MAEMRVERLSILDYLSKNTFLIPMYQRPYTWGEDECGQLWEDIMNFHKENEKNDEYFLGTSVMHVENEMQNLIDGQQRTTTLFLLIRALYEKACKQNNLDEKSDLKGLVRKLGSCLWQMDRNDNPIYDKPKLYSEVAIDSDSEILCEILSDKYLHKGFLELEDKAGINVRNKKQSKHSASKYAQNFLFFIEKSDEIAREFPTEWQEVCYTILDKCVILPIICNSQENALRIFNTLNNRGIPLSDSDIFKGVIFSEKKSEEEKRTFAEEWKELESELKKSKLQMDFIFLNYMHIVRAREGDRGNVIGLRMFFIDKHKQVLQNENSFEEIQELTRYWCDYYDDYLTIQASQFYKVLELLPNEYWKYLDSAYYFFGKDKGEAFFTNGELEIFLARLISNFLVKLIEKPTIATIKPITFNAYTSLYREGVLDFRTDSRQILENKEFFKQQFFKAKALIPSLLALNLFLKYPKQKIKEKGEIEHIFPKTTNWRVSYTGWNKDEAYPLIESIGNKMWLEKRLNIKASNNYFDDKKEKYKKSEFLEAQDFANSSKNDWLKADIEARNEEIFERLYCFFKENI